MHLSMYEKNIAYKKVVKLSKIMCRYAFFGIMRVMRSGPNYAISHPRVIPEALVSGAIVI